ncbi:MAG: ABC transporter ATP-binding protein [Elusimicrobiota bacterium]
MTGSNNNISIDVKALTRKFGKFTAVNNISMQVKQGEIFGFLGPNGAGKSTTIRMLCGIIPPTEGTAIVAGYDVVTVPDKVKGSIGYMSQKFSLYDDLTVSQNIDFYSGIYLVPKAEKKQRKEWVLNTTGLTDNINTLTSNLSGGWKQRLALACAVVHKPKVLFLDEPTAGVDPLARRKFWDLIYDTAANGTTILVTTHYLDEAENCNRIGLIYNGEIIAIGTPGEVKADALPENILELNCGDCLAAMDILSGNEFVKQSTPFGNMLHLILNRISGSNNGVVESIKTNLSSRGIQVVSAEFVRPSLEDVFIYLINEKLGR